VSKLSCPDFLNLSSLLTEEEIQIQQMAREFVDKEVLPVIRKHHADGTFPIKLVPKMAELGFFGATLPQEYGCARLNNVAYGLLLQELERGDSGIRSCASVQGGLVMYPIFAYGSEEQKIVCSMSRKGNCLDNAVAESFFKTLKVELTHRKRFATHQEAKTAIFEYMEVFYNRERYHSTLDYQTPVEYETKYFNCEQNSVH